MRQLSFGLKELKKIVISHKLTGKNRADTDMDEAF